MIQQNFIKLYEDSFKKNWDLPALTDYKEGTSYTYGELAREIAKLHLLFRNWVSKKEIKSPWSVKTIHPGLFCLWRPSHTAQSLSPSCMNSLQKTSHISSGTPIQDCCSLTIHYGKHSPLMMCLFRYLKFRHSHF